MNDEPNEHLDSDPELGKLIATRRAKANWFLIIVFFFLGLTLTNPGIDLLKEGESLVGPICLTISLPFFVMVWYQFSLSRDELCIFQNGLTYKRRAKRQACLWSDIKSLTFASGRSSTCTVSVSSALQSSRGTLVAIRKNSGELIELNEELKCEAEMIDAIRAFRRTERAANKTAEE